MLLLLETVSCTRSAVPYPGAVLPSTLTAAAVVTRAPRPPYSGQLASEIPYAVIGIHQDDLLTVRPVAGVEGAASGTLGFDQRDIAVTGQQTALGSSIWVEVVRNDGGTGWVNIQNLTEEAAASAFCADPRVLQVLDAVTKAVASRDGKALSALTSPRRGLRIRMDWRGPEVAYTPDEVRTLMQAPTAVDWGPNPSGAKVEGSFKQVVLPLLDQVLGPQSVLTCDVLGTGSVLREVRWPSEYANLNYYSFYRPAEGGGSEFSWITWAVGVEYVQGQPYLAALVLIRAGI